MKKIGGLLIVVTCLFFSCYNSPGMHHAIGKITLKVIDDDGMPIKGANAGMGFDKTFGWKTKTTRSHGLTNKEGIYTATGLTSGIVTYGASKKGYYSSHRIQKFKERKYVMWQPWNPEITVVLRKIENPVPMYQRDTQSIHPVLEIPISGKEVGFDLMESDWVSPYGKGKHPDILFRLDRKYVSWDDFDGTLTISFPNKYDGIQLVKYDRNSGSDFKLPRFAPEDGYQAKLVRILRDKPGEPFKRSAEEDNNYIFRVRSEEKDGKFVKAMYGKIHGDIQFGMRSHKTASILFKYFLNPDYTRNLENGKNLLILPDRESFNSN